MATGEYPGYTSYPAAPSNYSVANRPASNPINKIIVHVTQGSWAGTINRFQDSRSQSRPTTPSAPLTGPSASRFGKKIAPGTRAIGPTTRPASG